MPDNNKQKIEQLNLEIVNLKKMLESLHADNQPLNRAQMLAKSRLLDEKINQYMKLQEQKKTEERS